MTTPNDVKSRIHDYLSNKKSYKDSPQYQRSLQELLESDSKQTWREVLNPEEDNALMAFVDQINHAVESIDSVSPLNQLALQQTILLGGILTKLIPLAECGFREVNNPYRNARRKHIKAGDSTAEYHCLKIAIDTWAEKPNLRIGVIAKKCQKLIKDEFKIHKALTTYKDWIKAAHQAGVLEMPPGAQRPGA